MDLSLGTHVEAEVLEAMREVDDPELGVNIVDLGLVSTVQIDGNRIQVTLMMTTPTCPISGLIAETAAVSIERRVGPAFSVHVGIDRSATWSPDRATEDVRELFASRPSPFAATLSRFSRFLSAR